MVPFLSLRAQTATLKPEVMAALEKVIDEQGFANGPAVEAFEKKLASYLGVSDVVCVNSGTTSLHAALVCCRRRRRGRRLDRPAHLDLHRLGD